MTDRTSKRNRKNTTSRKNKKRDESKTKAFATTTKCFHKAHYFAIAWLVAVLGNTFSAYGFHVSKLHLISTKFRQRRRKIVHLRPLIRRISKNFPSLQLANREDLDDTQGKRPEPVGNLTTLMNSNNTTAKNDAFIKSIRNTLQKIDPFEAGYQFRRTLDSAITTLAGPSSLVPLDLYYLEDRLFELELNSNQRKPYDPQMVPEVLVVGAGTKIGQLIVRKLILKGIRVRVLVPNLYSSTLDLFGTKVVYCPGDLLNMESLEYAVTDVDKIIFCLDTDENVLMKGTAPKVSASSSISNSDSKGASFLNESYVTGLNNLLHAYQNVRFADYGAGQAAKRTLFKFRRPEDFGLFQIDRVNNEGDPTHLQSTPKGSALDGTDVRQEKKIVQNAQWSCWERNKFNNTSFFGRIFTSAGGNAAIVSTRLRARSTTTNKESIEQEQDGIDLSRGFSGFIVRLCGDGQLYECFVRTKAFDQLGIEYVYEFPTLAKSNGSETVLNKFQTVRMPFAEFKPTPQSSLEAEVSEQQKKSLESLPDFTGRDVRHIGFRFKGDRNIGRKKLLGSGNLTPYSRKSNRRTQGFYLALSYIKLYRSNAEPEFVYLSDSGIPAVVRRDLVRHKKKLIIPNSSPEADAEYSLFSNDELKTKGTETNKRNENAYYKYLGEQLLRQSGLSYAIVRVSELIELPDADISAIELKQENGDIKPISISDAANVCVCSILDPTACNKSFYVSKISSRSSQASSVVPFEEGLSIKLSRLKSNS